MIGETFRSVEAWDSGMGNTPTFVLSRKEAEFFGVLDFFEIQ